MSPRLISPWKRPNSAQYWFRMVVPPRYRQAVGKSEIKQSLGTDNIGEARRLCAMRQSEWLKKFELMELELKARDARDGVAAIDRYRPAILRDSRAATYEKDCIDLAEDSERDAKEFLVRMGRQANEIAAAHTPSVSVTVSKLCDLSHQARNGAAS